MSSSLQIKDLCFSYQKNLVLNGVNLEIPQGEIFVLLGASGCGKSTLLNLLAGFLQPREGSIVLGDKTLCTSENSLSPQEREIGIVFQDFALFPHLSVEKNVEFGWKESSQKSVQEWIASVGLSGLENRAIDQLSGGQKQRVALARTLANDPTLILLDEPLSSLDPALRKDLATELKSLLKSSGKTCIVVTHDPDEAFYLGDRLGVMESGKLLQVGTPEELWTKPISPGISQLLSNGFFHQGKFIAVSELTLSEEGPFEMEFLEQSFENGHWVWVCRELSSGQLLRIPSEGVPPKKTSLRYR